MEAPVDFYIESKTLDQDEWANIVIDGKKIAAQIKTVQRLPGEELVIEFRCLIHFPMDKWKQRELP